MKDVMKDVMKDIMKDGFWVLDKLNGDIFYFTDNDGPEFWRKVWDQRPWNEIHSIR